MKHIPWTVTGNPNRLCVLNDEGNLRFLYYGDEAALIETINSAAIAKASPPPTGGTLREHVAAFRTKNLIEGYVSPRFNDELEDTVRAAAKPLVEALRRVMQEGGHLPDSGHRCVGHGECYECEARDVLLEWEAK